MPDRLQGAAVALFADHATTRKDALPSLAPKRKYMSAPINRLAAGDEEEPEKGNGRSPAQNAASRKNGAKSHGPVTEAGKAAPSKNALKQGLLAKRFMPAADSGPDGSLYRRIHAELVDELQPTTFSDKMKVVSLTSDYVQATRARQMQELIQQPSEPNSKDAKDWQTLQKKRRELKWLTKAARSLGAEGSRRLNRPQAERVAEMLFQSIHSLVEEIETIAEEEAVDGPYGSFDGAASPANEDDQSDEDDGESIPEDEAVEGPFESPDAASSRATDDEQREEDEEVAAIKAEYQAVGDAKDRFLDRQYVADVLTGKRSPESQDTQKLIDCFNRMSDSRKRLVANGRALDEKMQKAHDATLRKLAAEPGQLVTMRRYGTTIERGIERAIAKFRKRARS
ncbi:MAG TPA: hypothetical protein VFE47_02600 [Tepidisphaeraceae bacterium]|nr:hypothetical protein [Tepidisphaeraceae bacterium]